MKSEQLIAKKVKHHFDQKLKQVLFDVESLKEHFDGLQIHESDIISVLESEDEQLVEYIQVGDVNFDSAVSKEVVETSKLTDEEITFISVELEKEMLRNSTKTPEPVKEDAFPVWVNPVLEIEVNAETLELNPEFVEAGIEVGDTITVDAVEPIEEIIPAKVVKKKTTKKQ